MPLLFLMSAPSVQVINGFPQVISLGSWLFHLGLLNSQYSSLEAALDQAGSIDLYFSCFSIFLFLLIMSSFADELRSQGLLDDIILFDLTPSMVGVPPTTGGFSDDSLRRTSMPGNGLQAGTKGKLFKLFLVEASRAKEESYCFSFIRKGATVCMKRGCATDHNGKRFNYEDGTLLIMKGPDVAFSDPTLEAVLLSDGLLKLWRAAWEPFEVWRRKFALATSLDATEATEVLMQESESRLARAAHFKTTAKGIQEFDLNKTPSSLTWKITFTTKR
jgi:hypothetical protein